MSGGCPGGDEDRRVDLLIRAMKREPLTFGMGFLDNDPFKKKKKYKTRMTQKPLLRFPNPQGFV